MRSPVAFALFPLQRQVFESVVDLQLALAAEALVTALTLVVGNGDEALVAVRPLQRYKKTDRARKRTRHRHTKKKTVHT